MDEQRRHMELLMKLQAQQQQQAMSEQRERDLLFQMPSSSSSGGGAGSGSGSPRGSSSSSGGTFSQHSRNNSYGHFPSGLNIPNNSNTTTTTANNTNNNTTTTGSNAALSTSPGNIYSASASLSSSPSPAPSPRYSHSPNNNNNNNSMNTGTGTGTGGGVGASIPSLSLPPSSSSSSSLPTTTTTFSNHHRSQSQSSNTTSPNPSPLSSQSSSPSHSPPISRSSSFSAYVLSPAGGGTGQSTPTASSSLVGGHQQLSMDKYKKLLEAYAKLKNDNAVLKKAVKTEREKFDGSSKDQNLKFEMELKEREAKIKTITEEIDLLQFNNRNLVKRVEALQQELQQKQSRSNSGIFGGGKKALLQKEEELDVLRQDLALKIEENASLYSKLEEVRRENEEAFTMMQQKLSSLKNSERQKQDMLDANQKLFDQQRALLESENKRLIDQIGELESSLESLNMMVEEKDRQYKITTEDLTNRLNFANSLIRNKIKFNDTEYRVWNQYNLPAFDKAKKLQQVEWITKSLNLLQDFIQAVNEQNVALHNKLNFLIATTATIGSNAPSSSSSSSSTSSSSSSADLVHETLKSVYKKLDSLLPDEAKQWKELEEVVSQTIHSLLRSSSPSSSQKNASSSSSSNTTNTLDNDQQRKARLFGKLDEFLQFSKTVLSCHLLRLEEESKMKNCSVQLQGRNTMESETRFALHESQEQLVATVKTLINNIVAVVDTTRGGDEPEMYTLDVTKTLLSNLLTFERTLQTLSTLVAAKTKEEEEYFLLYSNPGTFSLDTLRQLNHRFCSSLNGVLSVVDKLPPIWQSLVEAMQAPTDLQPVRGATRHDLHVAQSLPLPSYYLSHNHHNNMVVHSRGSGDDHKFALVALDSLKSRSESYLNLLNSQPEYERISYVEALENKRMVEKLLQEKKMMQEQLTAAQSYLSAVTQERTHLQAELTQSKDTIAVKQGQLTSVLAELASTRQKLEKKNGEYEKLMHEFNKQRMAQKPIASSSSGPGSPSLSVAASPDGIVSAELSGALPVEKPPLTPRSEEQQQPISLLDVGETSSSTGDDATSSDNSHQQQPQPSATTVTPTTTTTEPVTSSLLDNDLINLASSDDHRPDQSTVASQLGASPAVNLLDLEHDPVAAPLPSSTVAVPSVDLASSQTLSAAFTSDGTPSVIPSTLDLMMMNQNDNLNASAGSNNGSSDERSDKGKEEKRYRITVMDETGKPYESLEFSQEDKEREKAMKQYYESKEKQLLSQLKMADSKAIQFHKGYKETLDRMSKAIAERDMLVTKLQQLQQHLDESRDDIDVTRNNYESQMTLFTEHITTQNEKIAKAEEELIALKKAKVCCGRCKKWNTVEWLISPEGGKNGQRCAGGNHGSWYNFA